MSTIKKLHQRWNRDADYRKAYERLEPEFNIARALIEARRLHAEVPGRADEDHVIGGGAPPSLCTLGKVVRATGTKLRIRFDPMGEH